MIIIIGHLERLKLRKFKAVYNTLNQQSQILHNRHFRNHSIYKELSSIKQSKIFANNGITGIKGWCIENCVF